MDWMVDWLIDWSFVWWIDWLIDWLEDSEIWRWFSDCFASTAFVLYFSDEFHWEFFAGANKDALNSACLYIACNQEAVPRTLEEVCKVSTCSKKQVARCYREIFKLLKIQDRTQGREREFVERFATTLGLGQPVKKLASAISVAATEKDLFPDRGPDVVCGAAILLAGAASDAIVPMSYVIHVSGASRHGLSVAYRTMVKNVTILYPANFTPKVERVDLPKADELWRTKLGGEGEYHKFRGGGGEGMKSSGVVQKIPVIFLFLARHFF